MQTCISTVNITRYILHTLPNKDGLDSERVCTYVIKYVCMFLISTMHVCMQIIKLNRNDYLKMDFSYFSPIANQPLIVFSTGQHSLCSRRRNTCEVGSKG